MGLNLVPTDLPKEQERQHRTLIATTLNELVKLSPVIGTWTPADASGAGLTLTVTDARYWKLGSLVIASARITYPATASAADTLLDGLPFALNGDASSRQGNVSYATASVLRYVLPISSSTQFRFNDGSGVRITNVQLTGTEIFFQLIYQTP